MGTWAEIGRVAGTRGNGDDAEMGNRRSMALPPLGMEQTPRTFKLPDIAAGQDKASIAAHTCNDPLHADARAPGTGDVTTLVSETLGHSHSRELMGKHVSISPLAGREAGRGAMGDTVWPVWATI